MALATQVDCGKHVACPRFFHARIFSSFNSRPKPGRAGRVMKPPWAFGSPVNNSQKSVSSSNAESWPGGGKYSAMGELR